MAASLSRLVTRADRLRAEQAEMLRQRLLDFPDLPEMPRRQILAAIGRSTAAAAPGWTFVMINAQQFDGVVTWLTKHSRRPLAAVRVWTKCLLDLHTETGEIMLRRDEIAAMVEITSRDVSRIMGELESIGAISRHREKVAGMKGPGIARYYLNPHVGTHLPGAARDAAQADDPPPLLTLMNGGKV